jgi:hypothetical protein
VLARAIGEEEGNEQIKGKNRRRKRKGYYEIFISFMCHKELFYQTVY